VREVRHTAPSDRVEGGLSSSPLRFIATSLALLLLFLAVMWLANLETNLPDIRIPPDTASSEVLNGHALMMPGRNVIGNVDTNLTGDWVTQEIGDSTWLASELRGSRMQAAFYGTDIYLLVRMGPDANRAYVTVNGLPVERFQQDEYGSYVGLWAGETSDQPVLLARNLAHGEHTVEIIADGEGELAIAGFDVVASTPFPWAFLLGYIGIGGAVFLLIRSTLFSSNPQNRSRPDAQTGNSELSS
jgi:hypothetical protein